VKKFHPQRCRKSETSLADRAMMSWAGVEALIPRLLVVFLLVNGAVLARTHPLQAKCFPGTDTPVFARHATIAIDLPFLMPEAGRFRSGQLPAVNALPNTLVPLTLPTGPRGSIMGMRMVRTVASAGVLFPAGLWFSQGSAAQKNQ
jgi:hypothetical protein